MMLQPCFMKMMKVLTDRVTQTYDYVIEIDFWFSQQKVVECVHELKVGKACNRHGMRAERQQFSPIILKEALTKCCRMEAFHAFSNYDDGFWDEADAMLLPKGRKCKEPKNLRTVTLADQTEKLFARSSRSALNIMSQNSNHGSLAPGKGDNASMLCT